MLFFDGAARDEYQREGASLGLGTEPIIRVLSEKGNTLEAASNLFDILHELDSLGLSRIRAERAKEEGLGAAINDRLYKARSASRHL
ncbi:hypothetical protein MASR2M78_25100 [Treponema sp.]